jgi:Zn-dependent protease
VEVDVYDLPRVSETGRFSLKGGFAVIGRISGGAFAVARGQPMDWGFENLRPAVLVGSEGCSFMELRELLRRSTSQ